MLKTKLPHRARDRKKATMAEASRQWRGQEMALTLAVAVIIAILSLMPMLRLIQEIVLPGGTFSLSAIQSGLGKSSTWTATLNTLVVGIGGTLLAVVGGTLIALVVAMTDLRARNAFVLCFVMPLMIAPQVTALAWLQLFGPASPFLKLLGIAPPLGSPNPLYSPQGIIILLG